MFLERNNNQNVAHKKPCSEKRRNIVQGAWACIDATLEPP